jgi:hypothetical protein
MHSFPGLVNVSGFLPHLTSPGTESITYVPRAVLVDLGSGTATLPARVLYVVSSALTISSLDRVELVTTGSKDVSFPPSLVESRFGHPQTTPRVRSWLTPFLMLFARRQRALIASGVRNLFRCYLFPTNINDAVSTSPTHSVSLVLLWERS